MISWPATLPQFPHADYEAAPIAGVSSPDDQQTPSRKRTYPEFQGVFHFNFLTLAQQQVLRHFYDVDVNQVAPFSAPWLPAAGFEHHFCRFAADNPIQWEGKRGRKKSSATITVLIIAGVPVDEEGAIIYGAEG